MALLLPAPSPSSYVLHLHQAPPAASVWNQHEISALVSTPPYDGQDGGGFIPRSSVQDSSFGNSGPVFTDNVAQHKLWQRRPAVLSSLTAPPVIITYHASFRRGVLAIEGPHEEMINKNGYSAQRFKLSSGQLHEGEVRQDLEGQEGRGQESKPHLSFRSSRGKLGVRERKTCISAPGKVPRATAVHRLCSGAA
jgi:hypothetical protein